jgi:hypothetical protein
LYLAGLPLFTRGVVGIPNLAQLLRELRLRETLVQRDGGADGLIFKTRDNAILPAPQPEPEAFYEEEGFNEYQSDVLAHLINELREEWRRDHAIEIAELRGKVDALLTMLGQKSFEADAPKSGEVVELPNWRKRHVA